MRHWLLLAIVLGIAGWGAAQPPPPAASPAPPASRGQEYRTDPVSVQGAVRMPNLYYLQGPRTLLEVLGMAGGLADKVVANRVLLVRRAAAPPGGETPADSKREDAARTVQIPIKELLQTADPRWNVWVYPGDVVRVIAAPQYFVAGAVNRPGAYPLTDSESMAARQALAIAGGATPAAKFKSASVIHLGPDATRTERRADLARMLRGGNDGPSLGPNDVLFIPGGPAKEPALRAIEAGVRAGMGLAVFPQISFPLPPEKRRLRE